MNQQLKSKKNSLQIGIIICIILFIVYLYSVFHAVQLHKTNRIYIDLSIAVLWFILAIYWLKQLSKLTKDDPTNDKND